MDKVFLVVSFQACEDGSRELLDTDLYTDRKDAVRRMEQEVSNVITVYSRTAPSREYPIRTVGNEYWREVNIPRECTEQYKNVWMTWEVRELELPEAIQEESACT